MRLKKRKQKRRHGVQFYEGPLVYGVRHDEAEDSVVTRGGPPPLPSCFTPITVEMFEEINATGNHEERKRMAKMAKALSVAGSGWG